MRLKQRKLHLTTGLIGNSKEFQMAYLLLLTPMLSVNVLFHMLINENSFQQGFFGAFNATVSF